MSIPLNLIVFLLIVLTFPIGSSPRCTAIVYAAEDVALGTTDDTLETPCKVASDVDPALNVMPILMYDSNIGVGYGVKIFLLNQLHHTESFDLTLFNSTKGEQWYRSVGSWPDFELRQGKVYPIAADLTIEYDKLIKASFFGIGNGSEYEDREYYTKEAVDISLAFSRGLSSCVVVQAGVRFKTIRNYNFEVDSQLRQLLPDLNSERVSYFSSPILLRYDTRNSVVHPSRGMVVQAEMELAPDIPQNDVKFTRVSATAHSFSVLFYPKTVLALRAQVQHVSGHNLPVQVLLPLGGGRTMRGSPMDRFFGRTTALSNAEIRFPIYRRLEGIGGIDVGKVWDRPDAMDLHNWEWNPAAGLYYCLRTFVVRLDIGFGRDEWGVFLNFGHMF